MSDNLGVTPGSGATIAAKDDSGVLHQRSLLEFIDFDNSLKDVSTEKRLPVSVDELVYVLYSILEKMPRIDAADRLLVSHAESNPTVSISSNQTVATVTTVANVAAITQIGGRDVAHLAFAAANAGAMHIYNNILVTA